MEFVLCILVYTICGEEIKRFATPTLLRKKLKIENGIEAKINHVHKDNFPFFKVIITLVSRLDTGLMRF
jgi:hypothetical protein